MIKAKVVWIRVFFKPGEKRAWKTRKQGSDWNARANKRYDIKIWREGERIGWFKTIKYESQYRIRKSSEQKPGKFNFVNSIT